jgi:hypothetical protein
MIVPPSPFRYQGESVNKEQKRLYISFMSTPLAKATKLSSEEMFHAGCLTLRAELENFIDEKLEGERGDRFSEGQDDGLRWVRDHLRFVFDKGS